MSLRDRIAELVAREQRIVPTWVKEELQEIVRGVTCTCVGVTRPDEMSEHCVECRLRALINGWTPKFVKAAENEEICGEDIHITLGHPSLYASGTYRCGLRKGHEGTCVPE